MYKNAPVHLSGQTQGATARPPRRAGLAVSMPLPDGDGGGSACSGLAHPGHGFGSGVWQGRTEMGAGPTLNRQKARGLLSRKAQKSKTRPGALIYWEAGRVLLG